MVRADDDSLRWLTRIEILSEQLEQFTDQLKAVIAEARAERTGDDG